MTIEEEIVELHRKAHNMAFACYIRKGFIPLPLPEILQATTSVQAFLKYNPDEPRDWHGRWTTGGGGDASTDDNAADALPKVSVPGPDGQPVHKVNIFIGGAGDSETGIVRASSARNSDIYGDNYYALWEDADKINALIASLPADETVNLIGHSYGADTAAQVAIDNPGRINTLVTVDPVSHFPPDFASVRDGVNTWVNVDATGNPDSSLLDSAVEENPVAYLGGEWGNEPNDFAAVPITAPLNHAQFDTMMNSLGSGGKTPSQILNGH